MSSKPIGLISRFRSCETKGRNFSFSFSFDFDLATTISQHKLATAAGPGYEGGCRPDGDGAARGYIYIGLLLIMNRLSSITEQITAHILRVTNSPGPDASV